MSFNILPKGRSLIHLLALATKSSSNSKLSSIKIAKDIFYQAGQHRKDWISAASNSCSFEVPILPDESGNTALDLCVGTYKKFSKRGFIKRNQQIYKNKDVNHESENIAMAQEIFMAIKDYGLMHSSFFLNDAVIKSIELNIFSIREYLEGRFKAGSHVVRV